MAEEPVDALGRFDVAMQRAVAAGLAVALGLGVTAAVLGRELYPAWWWVGAGPAAALVVGTAVALGVAGRFGARELVGYAVGVAVSALLAAVAVGTAVQDVGTAMLPVVVVSVLGLGFLAGPVRAAALGGMIILTATVVPGLLLIDEFADFALQATIQTLILMATATGGWAARRLVAQEERTHEALVRALAADRAATTARSERREWRRQVHDTVLNTLTALGHGTVRDSAEVRVGCAADARFLRTHTADDDGASLQAGLGAVVEQAVARDFTVDLQIHGDVDRPLPDAVVTAFVRAVRESLTNARRHSGCDHATVDVRIGDDGVAVRVLDHGRGIAPDAVAGRLGVRRSLIERMDDIGGRATVEPGAPTGTVIGLRWPS